jgi:hypothetical protein
MMMALGIRREGRREILRGGVEAVLQEVPLSGQERRALELAMVFVGGDRKPDATTIAGYMERKNGQAGGVTRGTVEVFLERGKVKVQRYLMGP